MLSFEEMPVIKNIDWTVDKTEEERGGGFLNDAGLFSWGLCFETENRGEAVLSGGNTPFLSRAAQQINKGR